MTVPNPQDLNLNRLQQCDRTFHDWYRFILSFPPHLVHTYIQKFELTSQSTLLDPFCGTGTTIVEAKKLGIPAVGVEATPMSWFASRTKTTWQVDPKQVRKTADRVCDRIHSQENAPKFLHLKQLAPDARSLLLKNSIGDLPLHKCLVLRDVIDTEPNAQLHCLLRLALAHTSVHTASNLRFAPEVGISRQHKQDTPVFEAGHQHVLTMAADLETLNTQPAPTVCHHQDARDLTRILLPKSIDAVITSPPLSQRKRLHPDHPLRVRPLRISSDPSRPQIL